MTETLAAALLVAVLAVLVAIIALYRRLWLLMTSIECLCNNVDRLSGRRVPEESTPDATRDATRAGV